jgi:hypothetical protein
MARPGRVLGRGQQLLQLSACVHLLRCWRFMDHLLLFPRRTKPIRATRKPLPHCALPNLLLNSRNLL